MKSTAHEQTIIKINVLRIIFAAEEAVKHTYDTCSTKYGKEKLS
jgi:hypothetical protein